jgi:peroxiredoxin
MDDDQDIRSLYARKPAKPQSNTDFWRNLAVILASVFVIGVIYVYGGALGGLASNLGRMVGSIRVPVENKTANSVAVPQPAANSQDTNNGVSKADGQVTVPAVTNPASLADNATNTNSNGSTIQNPPPSTDTQPPNITNIAYVSGTYSVTVSWTTSENASSFIKYGTDLSLTFPSTEVPQKTTEHSIYINGLTPNTRYHYKIFSTDAAGNTATAGGTTDDDRTFTTQPTTNASPYSGNVAPDFTLHYIDNNEISRDEITLSQYRGKKVILNFWASWCTPCKMELPHLQAVWSKYRDSSDIMLLTVAGSQSDISIINAFMKQNGLDFIVCLDENDGIFNTYGITSIPRTYFLDKNGVIRKVQQSMFTSPGEVEFMLDSY